jgi:CHAT domain-containing protein
MATLWPVDDELAAQLVADFYARFRQSGDAAAALREAQLAALHGAAGIDQRRAATWAAFELVGELRPAVH